MNHPTLKENMTASVIAVRWNHPMRQAAELMRENKIRHLPVIGEDGTVAGIISDRDALRAHELITNAPVLHTLVGDYMSWPVITRPVTAPLTEVVNIMIREKISAVVITRLGAMCGIITSEDLLKVLREMLAKDREGPALTLGDVTYSPVFMEALREANAAGI